MQKNSAVSECVQIINFCYKNLSILPVVMVLQELCLGEACGLGKEAAVKWLLCFSTMQIQCTVMAFVLF
jgi:hypothetical protein